MKDVLLDVKHLTVEFNAGSQQKVHAVSDVSFQISQSEELM